MMDLQHLYTGRLNPGGGCKVVFQDPYPNGYPAGSEYTTFKVTLPTATVWPWLHWRKEFNFKADFQRECTHTFTDGGGGPSASFDFTTTFKVEGKFDIWRWGPRIPFGEDFVLNGNEISALISGFILRGTPPENICGGVRGIESDFLDDTPNDPRDESFVNDSASILLPSARMGLNDREFEDVTNLSVSRNILDEDSQTIGDYTFQWTNTSTFFDTNVAHGFEPKFLHIRGEECDLYFEMYDYFEDPNPQGLYFELSNSDTDFQKGPFFGTGWTYTATPVTLSIFGVNVDAFLWHGTWTDTSTDDNAGITAIKSALYEVSLNVTEFWENTVI